MCNQFLMHCTNKIKETLDRNSKNKVSINYRESILPVAISSEG